MSKLQEPEAKESLLDRMSFARRDVWMDIYTDFLQHTQPKKYLKDPETGEPLRPPKYDPKYTKVVTQEDFYELFRDWQFKAHEFRLPTRHRRDRLGILEEEARSR